MTSRLFILGSAGVPARYGGFETLAENLADQLSADMEIWVACSTYFYPPEERSISFRSFRRFFISNRANGISSLLYDLRSLIYAYRHSSHGDHILMLGIGAGIFLPFFAVFFSRNLYVHTDGLEWRRRKWHWFAKLWLRFSRYLAMFSADRIILDNEALLSWTPHRYSHKTCLITYGGDHLEALASHSAPFDEEYALVIARAEPENNLSLISDAFGNMPDKILVLVTNARETKYGRALLKAYAHYKNIRFIDAIYDQPVLLHSYRINCKVYLHGHSTGGTNPSLVEAFFSGVPILAMDNAFNRKTSGELAHFFTDKDSLVKGIRMILNPDYKHSRKSQMEYARQHYTWKKVADQFRSIL